MEITRSGSRQYGGKAEGGEYIVEEGQGGSGWTVNGAEGLVNRMGQVELPVRLRADVRSHGFWKQGTIEIFDIQIVNLHAGSYLRMTPEKALAKADKENKDLYLQACPECRRTFTAILYSVYGIPRAEALAAQKRLAALLHYKLKQEYSEMCGFVRGRMSIAIVRSNCLFLRGPRDKEARILYLPELTDGAVMANISPWQG